MTSTHRQYDVAVVGLGAMGAMTLWQLAARGAAAVGIEQFGIAHARGSSHGGSRIFRSLVFEGGEYVPLVRRSRELWRALERESGRPLLRRTGGLCIGTGGELVRDAVRVAESGGVDHELLAADEIRRRFPQHAVFDDDVGVFEPGAGVLHPEHAIEAAVERAAALGAAVEIGSSATHVGLDGGGVEIACGGRRVRARTAVLATGAWFTDLVPGLELPLRNQRSILSWFAGRPGSRFGPDDFPVFIRESRHLDGWGIPDVDGSGVKVGIVSPEKPFLDRPEDNWVPVAEHEVEPVIAFCGEAFPQLERAPARTEPCMNCKTPDGDFVVGPTERAPGLVLLGGFSGHGFKHAAGIGAVAADLALDGATDIDLTRFSPDRFATAEGAA